MKTRTLLTLIAVAIALALVSLWMGQQSYGWFPPQASEESRLVDELFSFLVTLGTFIFLGVTGTLSYSILFQQAGKYDNSDGPPIEGNVPLEIIWTAIPFVLVIWIALYSYQIYDQMAILGPMEHQHLMATAAAAPLDGSASASANAEEDPKETIEVHARQWAWEFYYPDRNVTSTELHLPNHQRVKLVLSSADVLHGLFIPAFRVKQDIIPGRVINFEFTPILEGTYPLRDSQFSGTYFAAMQTQAIVQSPDAYQAWLSEAASHPPTVAYNRAFDEYHRTQKSRGWKTVEPGQPPVVNYPSFQESNP